MRANVTWDLLTAVKLNIPFQCCWSPEFLITDFTWTAGHLQKTHPSCIFWLAVAGAHFRGPALDTVYNVMSLRVSSVTPSLNVSLQKWVKRKGCPILMCGRHFNGHKNVASPSRLGLFPFICLSKQEFFATPPYQNHTTHACELFLNCKCACRGFFLSSCCWAAQSVRNILARF